MKWVWERVRKPRTSFTKARCFKKFGEVAFERDLVHVPFNVAYVFDVVSDICWAKEEMYASVLDDHSPMKLRKILYRNASGQSKFITLEIRKAVLKSNALKKLGLWVRGGWRVTFVETVQWSQANVITDRGKQSSTKTQSNIGKCRQRRKKSSKI